MLIDEENELVHYGILRRSGRYPWNSGGNVNKSENTRNKIFLNYIQDMKRQGLTDTEICRGLDISTTEFRAARTIAINQQKNSQIAMAQRLKDKGYGPSAIGRRMNIPESTVRTLLAPGAKDKADVLLKTANKLEDEVKAKKFIDIGKGVESSMGISSTKLNAAVAVLREKGYEVHNTQIPVVGTEHMRNMKVLALPGTTRTDVWKNRLNIKQVEAFSQDGGRTYGHIHPPMQIHPNRVDVLYKEDGGGKADGMIYVRPGVEDISLGGAKYAQVRVQIGPGHYLKGMAMYKDDLPEGVDLQFNTSKTNTGNKLDALKETSKDPNAINPFGAYIKRQIVDSPDTPEERVTSAMNIVNEEGSWSEWSRSLSSQMLSKQSPVLAKTQLDMTYERRQQELKDLNALTNPTVKKKLLEDFAGSTDTASTHLKAAALPRQGSHVILPIESMKPTEIYAPNFLPGERVVLIRYPHGGKFEIPELVVNNNQREAKRLLGEARDAVGIHHSVASQLSGADFDGDTVLVISNNRNIIANSSAIKELAEFDPVASYPKFEGMKVMSNTQKEMGEISNLITDMTIQGATQAEIVRAVKHSMVVIDAEKKELDHRRSRNDNGIKQLKQKYQPEGGASTIISRKNSRVDVPHRRPRSAREGGPVDPVTGKKVFVETGKISGRTGKPRTTISTKLAEVEDARQLVSTRGTRMELLYANHSNRLKALANQARLDALRTPRAKTSPSAKKTYAKEVARLDSALALAVKGKPLERQAQIIANTITKMQRDYDPDMDRETKKKLSFQALEEARARTGAKKHDIKISPREWEAIQAGAISDSKLQEILTHADMDLVHEYAKPKSRNKMTKAKTLRAKRMFADGYTVAEIAKQLGVSVSTLESASGGLGS